MAKKTPQRPWAWGGITPGQQSAISSGLVNRSKLLTGKVGFQPFTPYKAPPVPTGSYDPALDAQLGQANRGYGDLQQDTLTANTRDTVDYGLQTDAINRGYGRTSADLNTAYGRDQSAHDTAVQNLTRSYGILADRQKEQGNTAGLLGGGAMLQAAAKRAVNQAIDRQPIETQWSQQQQDIGTARGRAGEDRDLNLGQVALELAPPSADNPLGGRRFQDRTTALTRAGRENTAFGLDVNSEKLYQAGQVGYVPPSKGEPGGMPSNERVNSAGQHVRTKVIGGIRYTYDDKGRIIGRKRVGGPAPGAGVGLPSGSSWAWGGLRPGSAVAGRF